MKSRVLKKLHDGRNVPIKKVNDGAEKNRIFGAISLIMHDSLCSGAQVGRFALG